MYTFLCRKQVSLEGIKRGYKTHALEQNNDVRYLTVGSAFARSLHCSQSIKINFMELPLVNNCFNKVLQVTTKEKLAVELIIADELLM